MSIQSNLPSAPMVAPVGMFRLSVQIDDLGGGVGNVLQGLAFSIIKGSDVRTLTTIEDGTGEILLEAGLWEISLPNPPPKYTFYPKKIMGYSGQEKSLCFGIEKKKYPSYYLCKHVSTKFGHIVGVYQEGSVFLFVKKIIRGSDQYLDISDVFDVFDIPIPSVDTGLIYESIELGSMSVNGISNNITLHSTNNGSIVLRDSPIEKPDFTIKSNGTLFSSSTLSYFGSSFIIRLK